MPFDVGTKKPTAIPLPCFASNSKEKRTNTRSGSGLMIVGPRITSSRRWNADKPVTARRASKSRLMEEWPRMVRKSQVRVKMSFQKPCSWKRSMSDPRSSFEILASNAESHLLASSSGDVISMEDPSTLRCWRVGQSKGAAFTSLSEAIS